MLQAPLQIRFNKFQLEYLTRVRDTEGTPVGEQIRRLVDREMARPQLPAVEIHDLPPPGEPLQRQVMTLPPRPKVRRR